MVLYKCSKNQIQNHHLLLIDFHIWNVCSCNFYFWVIILFIKTKVHHCQSTACAYNNITMVDLNCKYYSTNRHWRLLQIYWNNETRISYNIVPLFLFRSCIIWRSIIVYRPHTHAQKEHLWTLERIHVHTKILISQFVRFLRIPLKIEIVLWTHFTS